MTSKPGNPTAMEVFSNRLILEEILNNMSLHDLLNCRRVSLEWYDTAHLLFTKKNMWKITLGELFQDKYPNKTGDDFFRDFEACKKFPISYIQLHIYLHKEGNEDLMHSLANQIQTGQEAVEDTSSDNIGHSQLFIKSIILLFKFIKVYGSHITKLSIHAQLFCKYKTISELLLARLPNVEMLKICGRSSVNETVDDQALHMPEGAKLLPLQPNSTMFVLPSLKSITYHVNNLQDGLECGLFKAILHAATNLEEICDFRLEMTEVVLSTGKMEAVKDYCLDLKQVEHVETPYQKNIDNADNDYNPGPIFCHENQRQADLLWRFGELKPLPQLTTLVLAWMKKPVVKKLDFYVNLSLTRILKASQQSLKDLSIPIPDQMIGVELPAVFPNLKILFLRDMRKYQVTSPDDDNSVQGVEMNFRKTFYPKLEMLELYIPDLRLKTVAGALQDHDYIGSSEVTELTKFPSVKKLSLAVEVISIFDKEKLREYLQFKLPRVSHVSFVEYDMPEESLSKALYYCIPDTVESVELAGLSYLHDSYEFDSFFLGIPQEVCQQLCEATPSSVLDSRQKYLQSVRCQWPGLDGFAAGIFGFFFNALRNRSTIWGFWRQYCGLGRQDDKTLFAQDCFDEYQNKTAVENKTALGILDLPNLKSLVLKFNHCENVEVDAQLFNGDEEYGGDEENAGSTKMLNAISGKFGFGRRPDLCVTVCYDYHSDCAQPFATLLESVAPFIRIVHVNHNAHGHEY